MTRKLLVRVVAALAWTAAALVLADASAQDAPADVSVIHVSPVYYDETVDEIKMDPGE
ncbi:hypothetical protein [Streptomyces sp. C]|uniref:hypothetical protein n=1 Tax=Streptomyces sp. C TaxID=253839 RepID=UPI0013EAB5EC|nr:hypothetical protein [Streptomyces sp. C]